MLEKIKTISKRTADWIRSDSNYNTAPILERLSDNLGRELKIRLKELSTFTDPFPITKAQHLVIDNLTNSKAAIDRALLSKKLINAEVALVLIEELIEHAVKILQTEFVAKSSQATEIGSRVLNLLFSAKQSVKRKFSVITPVETIEARDGNNILPTVSEAKLLTGDKAIQSIPHLIISPTLLYQIYSSLFPAERMMVGAGRRQGQIISIDAVFDVTGDAGAGYVRANADRLGRALVAMSETDTYFALWIHSHPGKGKEASHPSGIDRRQERDWLRDYSADLVNAIMVEDRFVRFWGRALEERRIIVEITGQGIKKVSENENVYRLGN